MEAGVLESREAEAEKTKNDDEKVGNTGKGSGNADGVKLARAVLSAISQDKTTARQ